MLIYPAWTLAIGSVYGFLAVALGAFGAHALKDRLDPAALAVYQTGVQYQAMHALLLVAMGALFIAKPDLLELRGAQTTILCFSAGIMIFSGSLYALAFTGIKTFGAVTPVGGALFLAGWIAMFIFAMTLRNQA